MALDAIATSAAADDPDYPHFHVVPPVGRLNDPNGLLVDRGTYHAFYQFSPFHPHRKLVYWGHSSSTDLLHWRHHEPAIIPDSFYDRSLTEILVGGGALTFTLRSFVDPASSGAGLLVEDVLTLSAGSIRTFAQAPQAC